MDRILIRKLINNIYSESQYINTILSLVEERKKFVKACWECSHCNIFDKCQEEHRDYCEKEQNENIE